MEQLENLPEPSPAQLEALLGELQQVVTGFQVNAEEMAAIDHHHGGIDLGLGLSEDEEDEEDASYDSAFDDLVSEDEDTNDSALDELLGLELDEDVIPLEPSDEELEVSDEIP